MATMQAEADLLLCCVRMETGAHVSEQLSKMLAGKRDWTVFTEMADHHRVIPLVYKRLQTVAPGVLTEPGLSKFIGRFRDIVVRNLYLTRELLQLLERLHSRDITAVPFKGPLLAVSAFGNLSCREFGDLDLLLRPSDVPKARAVMVEAGYRPEHDLNPAQEAAYLRSEHAFQFVRDKDQLVVELHWRLQDQYLSFPLEAGVWDSLSHGELFGKRVLSFSPEYLFLYLCMHGAKHYWARLEWICCLPAVIRAHPQMRWDLIMEQAVKLGGVRLVHLGLLLAHELDGTEATRKPLSMMAKDRIAEELATWVWSRLFTEEPEGAQRELHRLRFYLKTRERVRDRLSIVRLASIRMPHLDSHGWNSGESTWLLVHYCMRPFRLLKRYGLHGVMGAPPGSTDTNIDREKA